MNTAGIAEKGGGKVWVQDLYSSQGSWVLYAIGERTALPTWLEFPDNNMQRILN
jgi:hypothetical protein